MNLVNRFLEKKETRGGVGALERVKSSLLLALDLAPTNLSSFLEMLAKKLTQELRRVERDLGAIAKDRGLNMILLNGLVDLLGIKLLEL